MINVSKRMVKLCSGGTTYYYYANYIVHTDNATISSEALALANSYTIVTVKALSESDSATEAAASTPLMASATAPLMAAAPAPTQSQAAPSAASDGYAPVRTTIAAFHADIDSFLADPGPRSVVTISPSTEVTYGVEADCDTEYCEAHGIPYYDIRRTDGCVVHAPGCVCVADIRPPEYGWTVQDFAVKFTEFLRSKNIDAECKGNDIFVGGGKAASSTSFQILDSNGPRVYTGIQVSINQDYDAIRHICTADQKWSPVALGDYGITTEEVADWLYDWLMSLKPIA